jgi:hypothetical protein
MHFLGGFMKLLISLLLLSSLSFAEDIPVTFDAPVARTDGSELLPSEIQHYTLYESCDGVEKTYNIDASAEEYTISDHSPGTCSFTLTVTDTDNQESDHSEAIAYTILKAKPMPPRLTLRQRIVKWYKSWRERRS